MREPTDDEITDAMMLYGGGFVSRLASLYRWADRENKRRIRDAFTHYWDEYRKVCVIRQQRQAWKDPPCDT